MKQLKAEFLFLCTLMSCNGQYSALNPSGSSATIIADMFWWLCGIAILIWILFVLLEFYTVLVKPGPHEINKTRFLVIGGGALFPVIVISISIYFSLSPLPVLVKAAPEGSMTVNVSAAQWWWRVKYPIGKEQEVELANEIWLPVNEPVQFLLSSEDVIHSFWIPSLAGKMDMIPGRTTQLSFTPTKTGHYRGACAEYCGSSHALMHLDVKVVERKVFNEWLEKQKHPAQKASTPRAQLGEKAFVSNGCISCHTIRGISTIGKVGPDLTHVGSRHRIGAGILKNNATTLHRWIRETGIIKPDVKMPAFDMLPVDEQKAISEWMEGLK